MSSLIFSKHHAMADGNETREASAIVLNGNQLSIALDATKLAQYEDDSIYLEFNDGGNINDQALIATTGSSIESFKFSVAANQFYTEIFTSGMTTSSSAVMDANTLDLMFDGGSLHRGDINPSQLIENLTIKNAAGTAIADAIASAEVVDGGRIELLLDHSKFASGDVDQSLTVEYDGSSNTIRSISGDFAESFTQNFTYQPKIGFSSIKKCWNSRQTKMHTLTFSGGKLDDTNAGDQAAQNKVKSALSIYTDSGYSNALEHQA